MVDFNLHKHIIVRTQCIHVLRVGVRVPSHANQRTVFNPLQSSVVEEEFVIVIVDGADG